MTFLLGRHDPATIFEENPDAPPNEYEDVAEGILAELPRGAAKDQVRGIVRGAFTHAFSDGEGHVESLSRKALRKAADDIHAVLQS